MSSYIHAAVLSDPHQNIYTTSVLLPAFMRLSLYALAVVSVLDRHQGPIKVFKVHWAQSHSPSLTASLTHSLKEMLLFQTFAQL